MSLVFVVFLLAQSILAANIYFPLDQSLETEESPNKCRENMELDRSQTELTCRCKVGFVNLENDCYKPFTQGPCGQNQYVHQWPKESYARCVKNPCKEPNTFPYQNRGCFKINVRSEACAAEDQVLLVDVATHQLECSAARSPLKRQLVYQQFRQDFARLCGPNEEYDSGECRSKI